MAVTELIVDLGAISRNLDVVRARGGGRSVFLAVKADAYGHGLVPVARYVENQVAGFGVATVAEGIELRSAGITRPILKLSPALPDELPAAIEHRLSLVVGYPEAVDALAAAARERGRVVDVHLKIDTGMGRVGVRPEQARAVTDAIVARPALRLAGVMTHLAMSDIVSGHDYTVEQLRLFRQAVAEVTARTPVEWVHSANSGAILNHELAGDNAIRPGIAVYGSAPEANLGEEGLLEQVATWTARVTQVRAVRAGEPVSYGATWRAPADTRVATVAVGYGDGYSRLLSSRGRVLHDGRSLPVVGRVCMDQILVDVGDAPVAPGDAVVLLGNSGEERITPQEIADLMGTIPYEVTCLITQRVPRRYIS